jgi:formate hydrogenlyase subunit 3/multisubunit Na+/H+ antiporter MnhD subunit
MVTPIYIIVALLGVAFALGFVGQKQIKLAGVVSLIALAFSSFVSIEWLIGLYSGTYQGIQIFTAGVKPPFSINLYMGTGEALFTSIISLIGFLGGLYLFNNLIEKGRSMFIALLMLIMGLNVVVMTRDIFNLFVFLEISSIAISGLIILSQNIRSLASGFKYLIATGVIAGILLIGIIFMYHFTGSLNIDDIPIGNLLMVKGFGTALFLILTAILLELKPFPANGWALDVYQGTHSGVAVFISAASGTAMLYALYKFLPFMSPSFSFAISVVGGITFIASNLIGIMQTNPNRLLGYSSVGQIGLLVLVMGLAPYLGDKFEYIAVALLGTHALAKAGLFWISGIVKKDNIRNWTILRGNNLLLILFGVFILALLGLPPFPSFFGKWELIMQLAGTALIPWMIVILLGSFLEAVYLFRWLGFILKLEAIDESALKVKWNQIIPPLVVGSLVFVAGYGMSSIHEYGHLINYIPLLVAIAFVLIDWLPVYVKNTVAILLVGFWYYSMYPNLESFQLIFATIFLVGGIITLLAGYAYKGKRKGFYPMVLLMFAGLGGLIEANTTLEFFFAWELMTIGSYFLIIRGKKSMPHALSYMLFSLGGAYAILAGFGLAAVGNVGLDLDILSQLNVYAPAVFVLLAIGFMTKTASLGLHIWLPGAHAEAETDVSPMVSAILLKAGLFGLLIMMLKMGDQMIAGISISYFLGWLGVFTAIAGNLMAALQEDAKRLLAYSSIGVLGYALFGLALMSHLGWLGAVSIAITHFMFKTALFLAIGGVVWRVKTKNMYQMGGLIKRMPFSFITVLISIIVLAGVPPLTGFAGKWIFFNAIMEKGWYLQGALVAFAGIIAFLYCFRLIHSIFLGQLKDEHRNVKEAPFWILVPQYIILAVLMFFSFLPNSMLKPIGEFLMPYFPDGALVWDGQMAHSLYGYWNGKLVMYVIVGIFGSVLLWVMFWNRKVKKVKQFDITFASERPFLPETTHYAYNFFAHYKKAVGVLAEPLISRFWEGVSEGSHSIADKLRRIYNGSGQTYLLHIIAFIVLIFLLTFGGF